MNTGRMSTQNSDYSKVPSVIIARSQSGRSVTFTKDEGQRKPRLAITWLEDLCPELFKKQMK